MAKIAAAQPKPIPIAPEVVALLQTGTWGTWEGHPSLVMPLTKNRKLYGQAVKVFEALGGKWSKAAAAIVFTENPDGETAIREACVTGSYINSKQLFQFFETPPAVSQQMVAALRLQPGHKYTVLEPSAGRGALIVAVAKACVDDIDVELTAIELDPSHEARLQQLTGAAHQITKRVIMGDFVLWVCNADPVDRFERIIMNPPFTRGQDMLHVSTAYQVLHPGGIMVAIMSPAWEYRSDSRGRAFRNWYETLAENATWTPLPDGSFAASGTTVRTGMLVLHKPE